MTKRPSRSALRAAAAVFNAARKRKPTLSTTPEQRREMSRKANAAQGHRSVPWAEVPKRKATSRYRCAYRAAVSCDGRILKGEAHYDRGGSPRRRACVLCAARLRSEEGEG